jgi:hypothetical protein
MTPEDFEKIQNHPCASAAAVLFERIGRMREDLAAQGVSLPKAFITVDDDGTIVYNMYDVASRFCAAIETSDEAANWHVVWALPGFGTAVRGADLGGEETLAQGFALFASKVVMSRDMRAAAEKQERAARFWKRLPLLMLLGALLAFGIAYGPYALALSWWYGGK